MSMYIVCLLCLLVGGALGAFMGYKVGFTAGELHSLYKGAAAAAKREEDEFLRKIEKLKISPKDMSATATLVYTVKEPNSGEEEAPICRENNTEWRCAEITPAEIQQLKERCRKREEEEFENAKAEIYRNLNC